MNTQDQLQQQISDLENKLAQARTELQAEINKNKPKDIRDLVTSYESACEYKKVQPRLSYENPGDRTIDEVAHARLKFTFAVLNEGHKFKMDRVEKRYYPWFINDSSSPSGLVFHGTDYGSGTANATSAAHLSLKTQELARHTGTAEGIVNDWSKFIFGK